MDPVRFDTLTKSLSTSDSRRGMMRAAVAAFASGFWLIGRAPGVAAACLPPGEQCHQSSECCSGRCNKRRNKCTQLPKKAHGCTIDDASCENTAPPGTACPDLPNGICRITLKGRPVCGVPSTIHCEGCKDNKQCVDKFEFGVGALCVRCQSCLSGTTCICPFFVKGGEG
jgi:hypothetical protein